MRSSPAFIGIKPLLRVTQVLPYFRKSNMASAGALIVLFWSLCALLAPILAPYSPTEMDPTLIANPFPSLAHPLGVDQLGRDMLSRLLWGARTVLIVAPLAVLSAAALGCALGLIASFYGKWVDIVVMRLGDIVLSFPQIILYLIVISKFGPSAFNIIAMVALVKAPIIARIVRASALEIIQKDFIAAARMRGESALFIMFCEILPNAKGPLIIDMFLRLGYTTITIGVLGFLGVGLPPPNPDWGGMVKDAYGLIFVWPHMTLIPAVAISSLVVGFNLLAIGIKELNDK
jgi:peptide/nickel transport system permease protein